MRGYSWACAWMLLVAGAWGRGGPVQSQITILAPSIVVQMTGSQPFQGDVIYGHKQHAPVVNPTSAASIDEFLHGGSSQAANEEAPSTAIIELTSAASIDEDLHGSSSQTDVEEPPSTTKIEPMAELTSAASIDEDLHGSSSQAAVEEGPSTAIIEPNAELTSAAAIDVEEPPSTTKIEPIAELTSHSFGFDL